VSEFESPANRRLSPLVLGLLVKGRGAGCQLPFKRCW